MDIISYLSLFSDHSSVNRHAIDNVVNWSRRKDRSEKAVGDGLHIGNGRSGRPPYDYALNFRLKFNSSIPIHISNLTSY